MWFQKPVILIIDDDLSIRHVISVSLKIKNKYDIKLASNGLDGMKLITEIKPDLILLDWIMPNMNGIEVLSKLKKKSVTSNIPVMMLTGKNLMGDIDDAFKSGVDDYLIKPVNLKKLHHKVRYLLRKSR
jgi:DNA-binding response OmpR family regulator